MLDDIHMFFIDDDSRGISQLDVDLVIIGDFGAFTDAADDSEIQFGVARLWEFVGDSLQEFQ